MSKFNMFKNKTQRKMFLCYVLNQVIFWITCLVQTLIRMSVSPTFSMGVEIQTGIIITLSIVCLIDKYRKTREWKKKRFILSNEIRKQQIILDLKLKFDCSYDEAVNKYVDTCWKLKFQEFESIKIKNRLRFKSIIKEVNFDDIPDSVKKRMEKAEKEVA